MIRFINHLALPMALFSLSFLLISCNNESDSSNADSPAITNPNYHSDIAPLFYKNCVSCHQNGSIAPFSLVNEQGGYSQAKSRAGAISLEINERTMPPWLAENSGQCNTFEHARWLNDAEIETITNWVSNGRTEGTAPTTPLAVPPLPGLTDSTGIASMDAAYSPTGNTEHPNDDYRCFVINPNISATTDQLLTAFEMQPGNNSLVHHIILFGLPNVETENAAVALDTAESGEGYTCFGGSGISANSASNIIEPAFLAGWAPGTKFTEYPENTGIRLATGRKMIMQVHYNLANADPEATNDDLTSVKLRYTPVNSSTIEALVRPIVDPFLQIPPTKSDHLETNTTTVRSNYRIWGVFPHMHTYGKSIDAYFSSDAQGDTCLFNVPQWNFEWQQFFFFNKESPLRVSAGDSITLNCHYDTSSLGNSEPVITWGDGTQDEMCLSFLYLTPEI